MGIFNLEMITYGEILSKFLRFWAQRLSLEFVYLCSKSSSLKIIFIKLLNLSIWRKTQQNSSTFLSQSCLDSNYCKSSIYWAKTNWLPCFWHFCKIFSKPIYCGLTVLMFLSLILVFLYILFIRLFSSFYLYESIKKIFEASRWRTR